jgi:peptidoglycan/LPS O-acetylase OafA/YrhL
MPPSRKTPRSKKGRNTKVKDGKHNRDHSLDVLRGMAVLFMVIAHVNAVFYRQPGTILDTFTWWGVTICFSVFLFVSASVFGLKAAKKKMSVERTLFRSATLLLVYYAMAAFLTAIDTSTGLSVGTLADIVIFKHIPEYTEFLIPFIMYPVFLLPLRSFLPQAKKQTLSVLIGSLGIYFISIGLYLADWGGEYANIVKGLLVGDGDLHRFGILSYLPVFATGFLWGTMIGEPAEKKAEVARNSFFAGIFIFILLTAGNLSVWDRYPPSLIFLLYGITFSFGGILAYPFIKKFKLVHTSLVFLGQNALAFYVYHILFLLTLSRITKEIPLPELSTIILYIVTLFACTIVIYTVQEVQKALSRRR